MSLYNFFHKFKFSHKIDAYFLSDNHKGFRWLYALYSKISMAKTIHKKGNRYKVLVKNGIGIQNLFHSYEDWMIDYVKSLQLAPNSTFIDVGVNTGQTLLKTVPFHNTLKYVGIEPNIYCFDYVNELIKLNKFENTQVYNLALSNKNEELELQYRYREDIMATTSPEFRKFTNYAHKVKVAALTGDFLCTQEKIATISLIKIDVEGGEYNVLKGFENTIRQHQPIILCEILPIHTQAQEVTVHRTKMAQGIIDFCKTISYEITNIETQKKVVSINDLSEKIASCNYVFTAKTQQST